MESKARICVQLGIKCAITSKSLKRCEEIILASLKIEHLGCALDKVFTKRDSYITG